MRMEPDAVPMARRSLIVPPQFPPTSGIPLVCDMEDFRFRGLPGRDCVP